jgi:hypothetical protein
MWLRTAWDDTIGAICDSESDCDGITSGDTVGDEGVRVKKIVRLFVGTRSCFELRLEDERDEATRRNRGMRKKKKENNSEQKFKFKFKFKIPTDRNFKSNPPSFVIIGR